MDWKGDKTIVLSQKNGKLNTLKRKNKRFIISFLYCIQICQTDSCDEGIFILYPKFNKRQWLEKLGFEKVNEVLIE